MKTNKTAQAKIQNAAMKLFSDRMLEPLSITDLAKEAGITRGTIYNNLHPETDLLSLLATKLIKEMNDQIIKQTIKILDPRERLVYAIIYCLKRTHEDPIWGKFIITFGHTTNTLDELLSGPPAQDLELGMKKKLYCLKEAELQSALTFIGSSITGAMHLIRAGVSTWRKESDYTTTLILRGLGVEDSDSRRILRKQSKYFQ